MKALPEYQRRLLELAKLDAQRARLQHTARNLPEQHHLDALAAERTTHRASVARATGVVEDRRAELARIEADVKTVEARLARDNERIQQTSSTKDIAALDHEIESLRRRSSDLEDMELGVMERLEEEQTALDRALAAQADVEDRARELTELRDAARENLRAEAKVIAGQRRLVTDQIPDELLALYDKQRERYGIGASELVGTVSSATNVTLDPPDLAVVRRAAPDDVILCPDSSAILVRTERSAL